MAFKPSTAKKKKKTMRRENGDRAWRDLYREIKSEIGGNGRRWRYGEVGEEEGGSRDVVGSLVGSRGRCR